MCVSAASANFSQTIVYTGRLRDPELGLVNVFGYQNAAMNLSDGPNAMLLHLPTADLSPEQFISVGARGNVLDDMATAVPIGAGPTMRGGVAAAMAASGGAVVFDHDIYTIVLADDANAIPAALSQVDYRRRPAVSAELCEFYAARFPSHTIVLCCFDNADMRRAHPLMLWYRPDDPDLLVLPGVDEHAGSVPALGAPVDRDHVLIWSTGDATSDWGHRVTYRGRLRHALRRFLPDRVSGVRLSWMDDQGALFRNGDFTITHDDLVAERLDRARLSVPDGRFETPAPVVTP
ncbi:hypothetical protein [Stackebrandtia soli]|uniref:hypothetical protein n=1 Tax=Stackebrandtia soli TaxID=1892856 RepID=UPI0039EC206B